MAEILCEVTSEAERAPLRQRVDVGRFKPVATEEMEGARRRPSGSGASAIYGVISVCGRRREMEDTVSVRPDFVRQAGGSHHFFGVFDGHGCSHVAAMCGDWMHGFVAEEMSRHEPGGAAALPAAWPEVMRRSFTRMDAAVTPPPSAGRSASCCRCGPQDPRRDNVGSTALVAVVGTAHIVVANCGDSRAVLCRRGGAVPLSSDHKPDRPDELRRIEAAGGRVIYWEGARVLGVLAVSRAIGDGYLKPYVTAEPEVTVTERREEEDEALVLGCDGLWDVVGEQAACDVVRMCLCRAAAEEEGNEDEDGGGMGRRGGACSTAAAVLTKLALARGSADNVSVVVVDVRKTGKTWKEQQQ